MGEEERVETLENQKCPLCGKDTMTLAQVEKDIPFFGKTFMFSMTCSSCKYHKADVESAEAKEPCKYTFEITSEEDMKVRVVKSAEATVKIPHMISMEPGEISNGFISNIEGLLDRFKKIIEQEKETEEDPDAQKKAKSMLKKIQRAKWGQERLKIIIEDKSGNSAIISEKAQKSKI